MKTITRTIPTSVIMLTAYDPETKQLVEQTVTVPSEMKKRELAEMIKPAKLIDFEKVGTENHKYIMSVEDFISYATEIVE